MFAFVLFTGFIPRVGARQRSVWQAGGETEGGTSSAASRLSKRFAKAFNYTGGHAAPNSKEDKRNLQNTQRIIKRKKTSNEYSMCSIQATIGSLESWTGRQTDTRV